VKNQQANWTICLQCQGRGKKAKRLRKKVRLRFQRDLALFEKNGSQGTAPIRPKGHLDGCVDCLGTGLIHCESPVLADKQTFPHVAIIGGGIGGVALAVACLHRGIPYTLYERDNAFNERSQGYGLTLQQASKAIQGLGIKYLQGSLISTRHVVHNTEGKIIGEWGIRKWLGENSQKSPKRTNIHISRQSLRADILDQIGGENAVQWGHQLVDFNECGEKGVELSFKVNGKIKNACADLVVGADGIRSSVRSLLIGEQASPLRYLGCIAILGICPLADIKKAGFEPLDSDLLDSATVFQTANGNERIYVMPFEADVVMWQLSFPMLEEDAKILSQKGAEALKQEAIQRCQWHAPIPQILKATPAHLVSGYPVYDRAQPKLELLQQGKKITFIGDAAHPMSPFKGQGANQALLDALSLAREITRGCRPLSQWREAGIRESVLTQYEAEMLARSAGKVKDSADAAHFLHSDVVLHEGNEPRGRCLKREEKDS